MRERRKGNYIWLIVVGLAFLFSSMTYRVNMMMSQQNELISDLSQVEYLSSSTQRLAKMINANNKDNKVIFYINAETLRNLDYTNPESLSLLEKEAIQEIANAVILNWNTLMELFELSEDDPEATYDVDSILLASDSHFNNMTNLSLAITEESEILAEEIAKLQLNSYGVLFLIVFFLGHYLIMTTMALKSGAELAVVASLDIATGLYNRSRCQEILKDATPTDRVRQPAVIVIDLNDLKKTNDIQGHKVGDELISTFASLLREATNIHSVKPFLGRYGGDEFVVYHQDIEKEENIQSFLGELAYVTQEFNKDETKKFTVSYAIGYAINTSGEDGLTTRQLFEEADEAMYVNKREMKKSLEQSPKTEETPTET
ncbi:MAG: GGDEF domain-containing protein [Eubacteriales bacterium]